MHVSTGVLLAVSDSQMNCILPLISTEIVHNTFNTLLRRALTCVILRYWRHLGNYTLHLTFLNVGCVHERRVTSLCKIKETRSIDIYFEQLQFNVINP